MFYLIQLHATKLQPPPPPEKSHPPLCQQPPLKVEILPSSPFLKIWLEFHPPSPPTLSRRRWGAHYVSAKSIFFEDFLCVFKNGLTFKSLFFEQDVFLFLMIEVVLTKKKIKNKNKKHIYKAENSLNLNIVPSIILIFFI